MPAGVVQLYGDVNLISRYPYSKRLRRVLADGTSKVCYSRTAVVYHKTKWYPTEQEVELMRHELSLPGESFTSVGRRHNFSRRRLSHLLQVIATQEQKNNNTATTAWKTDNAGTQLSADDLENIVGFVP